MEKISAARAREWSIELEKGLRCKTPGRRIEAIKKIGPRLQEWSMESCMTLGMSHMYGLVAGEDRTFANTILLRLADAFRTGDNQTRGCILKIFLLELKHLNSKGRQYDGILSKNRVPNYVELLKRVKTVFDTGDIVAKCLALRLFGCWADFAKDSTHIRYIILLRLRSSLDSEVKASLFAAGCFCRLSEDFALIVLEVLVDILSSSKTSPGVNLAVIRAFSQMRCSTFVASKAYKAGRKMLESLVGEECVAEMLSSLSKLAFTSLLLVPDQVDLLVSFLSRDSTSLSRVISLKCLYFMLSRGSSSFPVRNLLAALSHIIQDDNFEDNFQCRALRFMSKMFCSLPSDVLYSDKPDVPKLLQLVENASQSLVKAKRCLAFGVLVDISCSNKRARRGQSSSFLGNWSLKGCQLEETGLCTTLSVAGDCPSLVSHYTSLILSRVTSLMLQKSDSSCVKTMLAERLRSSYESSEVKEECRTLIALVFLLVQEYPALGSVIIDRMRHLIEDLISARSNLEPAASCEEVCQTDVGAEKQSSVFMLTETHDAERISILEDLMLLLCKFVNVVLKMLEDSGAVNRNVYHMTKRLVESIGKNELFDSDCWEICSLNMHCLALGRSSDMSDEITEGTNEAKASSGGQSSYKICWVGRELQILEFTKKLLKTRKRWTAYRVGMYSCCVGIWFAAAFAFRMLVDHVKSDSARTWFKSLMLMAGCESEIKLLLFPEAGIKLINFLQTENDEQRSITWDQAKINQHFVGNADLHVCEGKLAKAYSRISSAEEVLAAVGGSSNGLFYFQRWFLSLRAKVLEIMVDMIGLLSSHKFSQEELAGSEINLGIHFTGFITNMGAVIYGLKNISSRWNRLAKDYDLLATSFVYIDPRSFQSISKLALNCSLLAFCSAFALYFSSSPAYQSAISCSLGKFESFRDTILQDLVQRLWDVDNDISLELQQFMMNFGEVMHGIPSRPQASTSGYNDEVCLSFDRFAISSILCLQRDAKVAKDEKDLLVLSTRGLQLLSHISRKWMEMPFRTPKYFFKARPCIGVELFIFNADSRMTEGISISPGFQLSLNLCIQLKNKSREPRFRVSQMYCILASSSSGCVANSQQKLESRASSGFQACKTEDMVDLNEMLMMHVKAVIKGDTNGIIHSEVADNNDLVTSFVSFDLNERCQGFSTCLLDVSAFGLGSYQIKWHSCCVDNKGRYWSFLPLNPGPIFTVQKS